MELLKGWTLEDGSVELKLGPLRRMVPMGWNSASEESPCQLVRCFWGRILKLVLNVLESCHLESAAAAGTNYFCPDKDTNRNKQVSSSCLSSLTASFYCLTCPPPPPPPVGPYTEPAGKGEIWPQHHNCFNNRQYCNNQHTIFTICTESGLFCYAVTVNYWGFRIMS